MVVEENPLSGDKEMSVGEETVKFLIKSFDTATEEDRDVIISSLKSRANSIMSNENNITVVAGLPEVYSTVVGYYRLLSNGNLNEEVTEKIVESLREISIHSCLKNDFRHKGFKDLIGLLSGMDQMYGLLNRWESNSELDPSIFAIIEKNFQLAFLDNIEQYGKGRDTFFDNLHEVGKKGNNRINRYSTIKSDFSSGKHN